MLERSSHRITRSEMKSYSKLIQLCPIYNICVLCDKRNDFKPRKIIHTSGLRIWHRVETHLLVHSWNDQTIHAAEGPLKSKLLSWKCKTESDDLICNLFYLPPLKVWHTCHRTFQRNGAVLYLTHRLSIYILIPISHPDCLPLTIQQNGCLHLYEFTLGVPIFMKVWANHLIQDQIPPNFIMIAPKTIFKELLPSSITYPSASSPRSPTVSRRSGLLRTKQENGHRGEFTRVCESTEYYTLKYVLTQTRTTFIFTC